jgi:wobble nucleotide-excising tRNase
MDTPKYIPVKGTKLVRDTTTGAILNTDINEYNEYKLKKKIRDQEIIEKNKLYNRVDKIENDISEIKELLITMLKTGKINAD